MKIMTLFSINVAWVMGSFKTVPRQAHVICFFWTKAIETPTLVTPKDNNSDKQCYWHLYLSQQHKPKNHF